MSLRATASRKPANDCAGIVTALAFVLLFGAALIVCVLTDTGYLS